MAGGRLLSRGDEVVDHLRESRALLSGAAPSEMRAVYWKVRVSKLTTTPEILSALPS